MTGKDILEFPLEELGVPQAIVLMMQAATKCTTIKEDEAWRDSFETVVDNERLQLLSEKLEGRVEDAIEAAKAVRTEAAEEDEPNRFEPVGDRMMHLVIEDDMVKQVVVDGAIFVLACNLLVTSSDERPPTFCIKQWGHQQEHSDMEGNFRR